MDTASIYEIPEHFHQQGLDEVVVTKLALQEHCHAADLRDWHDVVYQTKNPKYSVDIAIVGKYISLTESYKSLSEALNHAGIHTSTAINIHYFDSETAISERNLIDMDAILVPGGFGIRGIEGKISTVAFARENQIPFLGICLGMQVAVIECARHLAKLMQANSTEFNDQTPYPVIALITEWLDEDGEKKIRNKQSDLGGTMRLGGQICQLKSNSKAYEIYQQPEIIERHRHRYEVNNSFVSQLETAGMLVSGRSQDGLLVEIVEITNHPWFVACQFHPEFTSTPRQGHPLFNSFITAALKHKNSKRSKSGLSP